jgi:hypothetical protein
LSLRQRESKLLLTSSFLTRIFKKLFQKWSFDSFHHQNKFIRDFVVARGFKLPANEKVVMNLLLQDYDEKKMQLSREIQLKLEFTAFARTGTRTDNLQKLYNALLTIKSTSTDVEWVFSTANW